MQESSISILLLIWCTLVSAYRVPAEYGRNQNPTDKRPSDTTVRLVTSNIIEGRAFDGLQSGDKQQTLPRVQSSFVRLPEDQIKCDDNYDCIKHGDKLECGPRGVCECIYPYCWVYYVDATRWPAVNVFTCGQCGSLGSSCNFTIICRDPGKCMGDNYCHCTHNAEHDEDGLCWAVDTTWALQIALWAMAVILFFAVIVMAYNLYVTRPWQNGCGTRRRRPARDVTGRNTSNRKTPAYTVRNFYGYPHIQDSSQAVQAVDSPSRAAAAADSDIQENINSEIDNPVQQESSSVIESPESPQQGCRCRSNESSSTASSVASSISSSSSTVNSERPLISSSDNSSTQNDRVFNRGQKRTDEYTESTRF